MLKLRLLKVDRKGQELALETRLRNCVVDYSHKVCDIGRALHELVPSRHVEAEGWVVINRLLADLNDLTRALLDQILAKNGHEHGLNAVNLLNDERLTKPDR